MTYEAGINRWTDRRWKERAKRKAEEGERKSSIVAEGTGRPSVASTCWASRLHFTPLSSPNSVPTFFYFFTHLIFSYPYFFLFFKFVLSHPENDTSRIDPWLHF